MPHSKRTQQAESDSSSEMSDDALHELLSRLVECDAAGEHPEEDGTETHSLHQVHVVVSIGIGININI